MLSYRTLKLCPFFSTDCRSFDMSIWRTSLAHLRGRLYKAELMASLGQSHKLAFLLYSSLARTFTSAYVLLELYLWFIQNWTDSDKIKTTGADAETVCKFDWMTYCSRDMFSECYCCRKWNHLQEIPITII